MQLKMKHAAALFGAALPALVAGAQTGAQTGAKIGDRQLTREEHVDFCVRRWERMAACKNGEA